MDYLCHPHNTSKYLTTTTVNFDFDNKTARVIEGTLDDEIVYTSAEDVANIVTLAVDYEGKWPAIGGIVGDKVTIRQLLEIGGKLRGKHPCRTVDSLTDIMKENDSRLSGLNLTTYSLASSRQTSTLVLHCLLFPRTRLRRSLRW